MPLSSTPFRLLDHKFGSIAPILQVQSKPADFCAEIKVTAIKGVNFAGLTAPLWNKLHDGDRFGESWPA